MLPKWQRGGRVSSLNAGLTLATGDVVMALVNDTSFDNGMVESATPLSTTHWWQGFADSLCVCATRAKPGDQDAGAGIHALHQRWQNGPRPSSTSSTASRVPLECSDFAGPAPWRLGRGDNGGPGRGAAHVNSTSVATAACTHQVREPHAMGHTDAPESWRVFFKQRLRWDRDMY